MKFQCVRNMIFQKESKILINNLFHQGISESADHADALDGAFRLNEVPFFLLLGDLNLLDFAGEDT